MTKNDFLSVQMAHRWQSVTCAATQNPVNGQRSNRGHWVTWCAPSSRGLEVGTWRPFLLICIAPVWGLFVALYKCCGDYTMAAVDEWPPIVALLLSISQNYLFRLIIFLDCSLFMKFTQLSNDGDFDYSITSIFTRLTPGELEEFCRSHADLSL